CGSCADNEACADGECPCAPACEGLECGDDGCGGVCGECDTNTVCTDDGLCAAQDGNSCETPYLIESVPFLSEDADSSDATNLMGVPYDACPDETAVRGASSSEEVWAFTPEASGVYTAYVESTFPVVLYVLTDCTLFTVDCFYEKNPGPLVWFDVYPECDDTKFDGTQCVGLGNGFLLEDAYAEVRAYLDAGTTYFFVVDGNAMNLNYSGPYSFSLNGPCTPQCDGFECGGDSCGMDCGECPVDRYCDLDQQCVTQEGNSCETPFEIPAGTPLPHVIEGSTSDATSAYGLAKNECPGQEQSAGAGSRDEVYAFTPTETGHYELTLEASFQGIVYVLSDCTDYTSACFFKETLGHNSWTSVVSGCSFGDGCLGMIVEEPDALLEVELPHDRCVGTAARQRDQAAPMLGR
ncbi:MAG: hypothetical protein QF464_19575, partial [Myxococcota bacterium]|nr:hypothetical protein [Myxococcota bacterium]